jgi:hypothetical protein
MTEKHCLTYEQLMATSVEGLQELLATQSLDDATLARVAHVRRFLGRIAEMGSEKTRDDLTEQQLQNAWSETAPEDEEAAIARRPLIS